MTSSLTRLDKCIRRLKAQRACLDWAAAETAALPGVVLEFGLGNGRTYDHLRARLPGRDIYVFERWPQPHPDAMPPSDRLIIGNLEETLPAARPRFVGTAALIHSDLETGDAARNRSFAAWIAPQLSALLAPGGIIASDQDLPDLSAFSVALPPKVPTGRYFLYRPRPAGIT